MLTITPSDVEIQAFKRVLFALESGKTILAGSLAINVFIVHAMLDAAIADEESGQQWVRDHPRAGGS